MNDINENNFKKLLTYLVWIKAQLIEITLKFESIDSKTSETFRRIYYVIKLSKHKPNTIEIKIDK